MLVIIKLLFKKHWPFTHCLKLCRYNSVKCKFYKNGNIFSQKHCFIYLTDRKKIFLNLMSLLYQHTFLSLLTLQIVMDYLSGCWKSYIRFFFDKLTSIIHDKCFTKKKKIIKTVVFSYFSKPVIIDDDHNNNNNSQNNVVMEINLTIIR